MVRLIEKQPINFHPHDSTLYKDRCTAAILDLEQEAYFWPNISEKKVIEKFLINMQYIPRTNCVGIADNTLFLFAFQPQRKNYPDFKGPEGKYSITYLIVKNNHNHNHNHKHKMNMILSFRTAWEHS